MCLDARQRDGEGFAILAVKYCAAPLACRRSDPQICCTQFAVEGIVSSVIPPDGKLLVASNGAYGLRMGAMAKVHGIDHTILQYADNEVVCPEAVAREVKAGGYTHVGVIHHETTAGVLNPVEAIGAFYKRLGI